MYKKIKMRSLVWILMILTIPAVNAQVIKGQVKFIHPGMMQTKRDLDLMKQRVLSGQQPWADAFKRLKEEAASEQSFRAFTHISQGPYGADDVGGKQLTNGAKAAYDNALLWYITNDKAYADKSIGILRMWSDKLWDLDDNNAKLLAGLTGHYFLNAAEILKYSNAGWPEKDINQFKKLMLTVYYPLIKDFFPEANGNWDASMINTMLCIGVFCDNHEIFDRAVNRFYLGTGNGGITKYIYPGGQVQETSRDWGHVQLGIGEFAKAAQTAWSQGVDFYSAAGNRLALGFEYTAKYLLGEDVPVYGNISVRERQSLRDIYEPIYDHYHNLMGFDMPYTSRIIARTRPKSAAGLLSSFNNPVHSHRPKRALPPGLVLRNAGALNLFTANPPPDAVMVNENESIQTAIDAHAEKGGWIILSKGVHQISQPLRMYSNITLSGQGKESILFPDPKANGRVIINAENNMHNVALRDFLIEGATSVLEGEDPNNNRRTRANQNAPSREGIVFSADTSDQMQQISLLHLTVQNFVKNGVSIKGATKVLIDSCDFSGNGSSVVPGPGIHHNLNLAHVSQCLIAHSRFDSSPWGNGIAILQGSNIKITNCEAARNKLSGVYEAETDQITMEASLFEGNDSDGITLQKLFEGNHRARITGNVYRNNAGKGLNIGATNAQVHDNYSKDNGNEIRRGANPR